MNIINLENKTPSNNNASVSTSVKKGKFKRSTVIYNFLEFIVKNVYLINDYLDEDLHANTETE